MNYRTTIEEIGILETNMQIEKYLDDKTLTNSIKHDIPIPSKVETKDIINNIISKLIDMKKENIFILSNEMALIESLLNYKNIIKNIIVALSRNLSEEQVNIIKNNIPKNNIVHFINELEFPLILKPKDSVILVFGYMNANNCIVPNNTYRMVEIYKGFLGKKIFINCISDEVFVNQKDFIKFNINNYFDVVI